MNYQKIYKNTISDGNGVRCALYVSGCVGPHCKGCHNPEAWEFCSGIKYTDETEAEILAEIGKSWVKGLSLLGGDPYDQPDLKVLVRLVRKAKMYYPDKDIWVWTKYEFDQVKFSPLTKFVDVLITGRFILEQRDISDANRFRGSTNQRVIDVKASLTSGKTVGLSGIPNNEI